MPHEMGEYPLPSILASKQYPQVLRVTRSYYAHGKEYLKKGQFITVLHRKKAELITGHDRDGRVFRIRKDRSAYVEVIEEERIVYNLGFVVENSQHINAIEIRKELRLEKQNFKVGEKFTVEKVLKNFRGKTKQVALRCKTDGKIYRFPLDIIGVFKLLTGKASLPLSKVLTLRTTPVTARFTNSSATCNLPSGIVSLGDSSLCDVAYILTVTPDVYQYEVIAVDSNIYVEKVDLVIPRPILAVIPNGIFVNSAEYMQSIRQHYKQKIADIDSKLVEDIYSQIYYGSASFDRTSDDDSHLINRPRVLSETKSFERSASLVKEQNSPSGSGTSSPTTSEPPTPFPRYSKKAHYRNTISFPATISEQTDRLVSRPILKTNQATPVKTTVSKRTMDCGTSTNDTMGRRLLSPYRSSSITSESSKESDFTDNHRMSLPMSLSGSVRSRNSSTRSSASERQGIAEDAARIFYNPSGNLTQGQLVGDPPPVARRHSRTPSNTTAESFDSGVVLTHTLNSPASSALGSPSEEKHPIYAKPQKNFSLSNVRKITIPLNSNTVASSAASENNFQMTSPPLPPRDALYQNIHNIQVDIDINEGTHTHNDTNNNNNNESDYNDIISMTAKEPAYERLPYDNLKSFDFRSQSIDEPMKPKARKAIAEHLSLHFSTNENPSYEDVGYLSQVEVNMLLSSLNLSGYIPIFQHELINGQLLQELDERTLINDLRMTPFHARKLYKYTHGWRPIQFDFNDNEIKDLPANPLCWSVDNVYCELTNINLASLATFCKENQVDGALLKDIVESDLVSSLRAAHGVSLSGIELSRLRAFVLKKWRPDNVRNDTSRQSSFSDKKEKPEKSKYKPLWNRIVSQATGSA